MAQQPNIEITSQDQPRPDLVYAPPRREGTSRPGVILAPSEMARGPGFGTPGPDTGWALKLVRRAEIPDRTPALERVLAALMGARAARFGRAPTPDDLEVALLVTGLGTVRSAELDARRGQWTEAVAHEPSPGRTAAAQAGKLLFEEPAHVSAILKR